jgi:DNA-binding beta-propeller fold protein YncE
MEMFRPEEEGFAGVFAFDLRNGNLIRSYVLANDTQKHALGDLTLTKSGVVYATDSLSPAIYRTSSKLKHLELFLDKGPFVSPQGVAFSPDEKRMFVADYPLGVFAVEVKTKKYFQLPAPANVAITGVDGLYYYRGALIGIQNGTSPNRLVRFRLNASQDRIESAEVLEVNNPDFDEPSLAVLDHDVIYYNANSQWGKVNKDHQLPPETDLSNLIVLKLKL